MYPFERFTENAKKVLTLAQKEAERSHHSYIGTEHLLLGILELGTGSGHDALVELGIKVDIVREAIQGVLERNERVIIQQIIPTSRVKRVIEIAFEEARRTGRNYVDSGHLLLGLVIEGEGIAAHVLADLGADPSDVVATVERIMGAPPSGRGGDVHRLARNPRIAAMLRKGSAEDVERIAGKLRSPPDSVMQLRARLEELYRLARDARQELRKAEDEWLREITE